ncbi:MAG: hypothetical protein WBF42_08715 [Terracidiphilus sp.]
MVSMKKWVLGAAVLAGALSLGANKAQAAEFGVYVGGPVAVVPPCPGDGYAWVNGYWAGRRWFPGRWNFVGVRRSAPVMGYRNYHRGFVPRYAPYRR